LLTFDIDPNSSMANIEFEHGQVKINAVTKEAALVLVERNNNHKWPTIFIQNYLNILLPSVYSSTFLP